MLINQLASSPYGFSGTPTQFTAQPPQHQRRQGGGFGFGDIGPEPWFALASALLTPEYQGGGLGPGIGAFAQAIQPVMAQKRRNKELDPFLQSMDPDARARFMMLPKQFQDQIIAQSFMGDDDEMTAYQKAQLALSQERLDFDKQKWGQRGTGIAGIRQTPLTQADIDFYGQIYNQKGTLPAMYRDQTTRQAILASAARQARERGKTGTQIAADQMGYRASTRALSDLRTRSAQVENFARTLKSNISDVKRRDIIKRGLGASQYGPINWLQNAARKRSGDPDVTELQNWTETIRTEYMKIMMGQMGNAPLTDAARSRAEEMLNTNMTYEQYMRNLNVMLAEIQNRGQALQKEQELLMQGVGDPTGGVVADDEDPFADESTPEPPAPGEVPVITTQADYDALPPGSYYYDEDGNLAMKE